MLDLSSCQLDAGLDFRNRDGADCDVVAILYHVVKIDLRPLSIDQEGRVEEKATQNRSSVRTRSRSCLSNSIH